jgi:thiamine biosynthesis lipoprotein
MPKVLRQPNGFVCHFKAMGSPCEILIDGDDEGLAQQIADIAATETTRIEHKFSRYRDDNIIYQVNNAHGETVTVDEETARLLDYAAQLYTLSEGSFDITSGVLRRAWTFDGSDQVPTQAQVTALLPLVGWSKVSWHKPQIRLPEGMEIDLGGIGKEYAADRVVMLIQQFIEERHADAAVLVNLGGDIAVSGPRRDGEGWQIGIDSGKGTPQASTDTARANNVFALKQGGVATSGDARRYLEKNGVRYSHVLDPHTGWPVTGAPTSVTVVANTCTDAGMLSTFALLHGAQAEEFLRAQNLPFWC